MAAVIIDGLKRQHTQMNVSNALYLKHTGQILLIKNTLQINKMNLFEDPENKNMPELLVNLHPGRNVCKLMTTKLMELLVELRVLEVIEKAQTGTCLVESR